MFVLKRCIVFSLRRIVIEYASNVFRFFTKMPHDNYLEVTHLLLKVASDDINHADDIRTLVKVSGCIVVTNHDVILRRIKFIWHVLLRLCFTDRIYGICEYRNFDRRLILS